uniref:WAT1-related protein n=1 Tax=Rhizophora mucronata TaxID=61149 RepID=A0A2P2PK02_RHIMU
MIKAPITLQILDLCQFCILAWHVVCVLQEFWGYLPKNICSAKMMELNTATTTMHRGLKAVTNTGPLSFMITP